MQSKLSRNKNKVQESLKPFTLPLWVVSLGRLLQSTGTSLFIPLLPIYLVNLPSLWVQDLPVSVKVGILASLFGLSMTVIQSPVARLSDHWNCRKALLLLALFGFVLSSIYVIYVSSFEELLLARILQGLSIGATLPLLMALVAAFSKRQHRGKAMGLFGTFHLLGFIVGPLLGGVVADLWGMKKAFWMGVLLGISCILMVFWFVPEINRADTASLQPGKAFCWREHHLLALALFALMIGITVIIPLFPLYQKLYGASYSQLSWVFSAIVVSRLLTQLPVGYLADGRSKKKLILGGLAGFSGITFLLGSAGSVESLIVLRFLQGIFATLVIVPSMALGANLAPKGMGSRAMGILGTGFTSGVTLGPLFGGLLASQGIIYPFLGSSVIALFVCVFLFFFLSEEGNEEKKEFSPL